MATKDFAVIFDMDGVIADTNPHHEKSIKEFCKKYNKEVSDEFLKEKVYGRRNETWIPELFGKMEYPELKNYADEKEELFRDIYHSELEAIQGLPQFLNNLNNAEIKMAVATSAPKENADFILQGLNIEPLFHAILHSAHVSQGKPHPQIYQKAAQALNYSPDRCIVFEDSLSGIAAAQAAGCKVIGITTTHSEAELAHCDMIIKDFKVVSISILESLFE